MQGMKAFEFRIWTLSYKKHKGNFVVLNTLCERIRARKIRDNIKL